MKKTRSHLLIIFTVVWAILSFGFATVHAASAKPYGVWPMQPGWEVTYESEDQSESKQYRLLSITETEEGQVYQFLSTYYSSIIFSFVQTYLKDPDGDIYYVSSRDLATDEIFWYDPPILFLDLPLRPGKTWESKSTYHSPDDIDGQGEPKHHVFRIEATDIETPMGKFETLELIDEPLSGRSMGGDFYLPGFGPVAFESDSPGKNVLMTGNSLNGWAPDKGHGQQVSYNFGWKPGMAWRVVKDAYVKQTVAGVDEFPGTKLTFSLKADWMPNGLIVTKKDFSFPGFSGRDTFNVTEKKVIDLFDQMKIRIMVGNDGVFQGLMAREDVDQTHRRVLESFLEIDAPKMDNLEHTLQKMRQLSDPDYVEQAALVEWVTMVGTWSGSTVEIGRILTLSYPLVLPTYPDRPLKMKSILATTERCPCEEGSPEFDCVKAYSSCYTIPEEGNTLKVVRSTKWIIEPEGMFLHHMETYTRCEISEDQKYEDATISIWEDFTFTPIGIESKK